MKKGKRIRFPFINMKEGDCMKHRLVSIAVFILIGFFMYRKWTAVISIATVMVYTIIFSLLLAPVCTRMERRGICRFHAAAYAVAGLFLMMFLLFSAFIPYLAIRATELFKRVSPVAVDITRELKMWVENFAGTRMLFNEFGGLLSATLSSVAGTVFRIGMTAASQIGRMFFSLILAYYVLRDRKKFGSYLLLIIPLSWRKEVIASLLACRSAMMSYFSGMLKTSVFVATTTGLGLLSLGVQDAFLLALLMGVFEVFPYVGPVLASIPILLSALMQGGKTAILVLVMLVLVQQIEGSFITPYFTASSTSVHPLAAVFGVFAAGSLLGIWGILLAIPIAVLVQSVFGSAGQLRRAIKSMG